MQKFEVPMPGLGFCNGQRIIDEESSDFASLFTWRYE